MTSEALKNTVYIIHATLINFSNFYYMYHMLLKVLNDLHCEEYF